MQATLAAERAQWEEQQRAHPLRASQALPQGPLSQLGSVFGSMRNAMRQGAPVVAQGDRHSGQGAEVTRQGAVGAEEEAAERRAAAAEQQEAALPVRSCVLPCVLPVPRDGERCRLFARLPDAAAFLHSQTHLYTCTLPAHWPWLIHALAQETPFRQHESAHGGGCNGLAFSPSGLHAASCGNDGAVRLWTMYDGALATELRAGSSAVAAGINSVALSDERKLVLGASNDKSLKAWDMHTGRLRFTMTGAASVPNWSRAMSVRRTHLQFCCVMSLRAPCCANCGAGNVS